MRSRVEAKALALLKTGARLSKYDLATLAHCDHRTAARMLVRIHTSGIGVRICGWVSIYRAWIPMYRMASGVDVCKPTPLTPTERARRYRANAEVRWDAMMKKRSKRLHERCVREAAQCN